MPPNFELPPAQLLQLVTQALRGRVIIPLSAVRQRLDELTARVALDIEPDSGGLHVRGQAHALGAPIRFAARIDAEGVFVDESQRTVSIRLSEVELTTDDDAPGPLAEAIRTQAIDTDNPATLIGNMITLPDMVVAAEGSEVIVDLLRAPAFRRNETLRAAFAAATSYLCVVGVDIVDDSIVLPLGFVPGGPKVAALSTARAALTPIVRYLWPEGRS